MSLVAHDGTFVFACMPFDMPLFLGMKQRTDQDDQDYGKHSHPLSLHIYTQM